MLFISTEILFSCYDNDNADDDKGTTENNIPGAPRGK